MLVTTAQSIRRAADRHWGVVLLVGLAVVGWHNWRLWRRDRALADRLRDERAPLPKLSRTPKVSALVAAWNESANIDAHIQSFLALEYPEIELVLCAGGSDDTLERARLYASKRVIVLEQQLGEGKQRALAHCMQQAQGELIYLTDADCIFHDEALVRLMAPLIEEGEQVSTGGSRPLDEQEAKILPAYLWASDVVANAHFEQYVEGLLGRNAAVTRSAIDRIGGLGFEARTGTDYQLAQRLLAVGLKICYVKESIVKSRYPETIRDYRHRQSRWLRNLLIYGLRYGAKRDVRLTLKTIATGMFMLLAPLVAMASNSALLICWLLLLCQATTSKLRYAMFAVRLYRGPISLRLFAAALPLTLAEFVIWSLPIYDLLNPQRREQW